MNANMKPLRIAGLIAVTIGLTALVVAGCINKDEATTTLATPPATVTAPDASSPHSGEHTMAQGGHAMGTRGLDALKSLKGKEFDVAFLSQMIAHHEAAVQMAKDALKGAAKAETRQEAQTVIDAQTKEIAQMTRWLKDWYNAAPDASQQALVRDDMKAMMSMPASTDRMFFEMMIPHHQGAINMSNLVPERSERAEVKRLAQEIIVAQKKEIENYRSLLGNL